LPFPPLPYLTALSERYCRANSLPISRIEYQHVVLDPLVGMRISDAYMAAPSWDGRAIPAYDALRDETIEQFRALPIDVQVVPYDPYTDAQSMAADLAEHRLKVYSTAACGNPHPFLNDTVNDMFRALHDAFGHAATGAEFDSHGEEAAWLKHSQMYSPLARSALATETRGQNCAFTFHYKGLRFPEQKVALLPAAFASPGAPG
jgi:hypothetical protein